MLNSHHADADTLNFLSNSFDIVYAATLLHHVNIAQTLDHILRILCSPEASLVSWDPLRHNLGHQCLPS